jgi:hypothetical protein
MKILTVLGRYIIYAQKITNEGHKVFLHLNIQNQLTSGGSMSQARRRSHSSRLEESCCCNGSFSEHLPEHFGENVFSLKVMKEVLSP